MLAGLQGCCSANTAGSGTQTALVDIEKLPARVLLNF
jgi:hypothetical protein